MGLLLVQIGGLLLAAAAAQQQRPLAQYGSYGKDFYYYQPNNSDSTQTLSDEVRVTRWAGRHNKTVDIAEAQPFITQLVIPPGKQFADSKFWLRDDCSYVVISGNATFGAGSPTHGYGDVFWVMAGWTHGPIVNAGDGNLVLNAVGMDWVPQFGAMPSWYNPSVNWYLYVNRSYLREQEEAASGWVANPSPHTAECMANGGVQNMNFMAIGNTMPVLRVKWAANCSIPFHYHPTGAMYFILYGRMYYAGDFVGSDTAFAAGDSRWVRPGFAYGPEYNDNAPMEITVFGTDTPPEFSTPPEGPYKVQKTIQLTHIFEHQAGIIPHNATSEMTSSEL